MAFAARRKDQSSVIAGEEASLVHTSPVKSKGSLFAAAFAPRSNPPNTEFRRYYERGDLPVSVDHGGVKNRIQWKIEIEKLDLHHYLPIFFDGLREVEVPYSFLAEQVKTRITTGLLVDRIVDSA